MENEIEQPAAVEAEAQEEQELDSELSEETTDWKAEAIKARRIASRLRGKLTKVTEVKVEPKQDSKQETAKPEESVLLNKLERMALRQAGLTHPDDVELARATAKKWNVDIDEVLEDEDFKVKLERQQTTRDNAVATSNIKGGAGTSQAKFSPEYWLAKGVPPSASDVPDRKTRAKIVRSFIAKAGTNGKTFYND